MKYVCAPLSSTKRMVLYNKKHKKHKFLECCISLYIYIYTYIFVYACFYRSLHCPSCHFFRIFEIFTLLRSGLLIFFQSLAVPTGRWRGSACSASRKLMEIPNHAWCGRAAASKWRQVKLTLLLSLGLMLGPTLLASKSMHANVQAVKPVRDARFRFRRRRRSQEKGVRGEIGFIADMISHYFHFLHCHFPKCWVKFAFFIPCPSTGHQHLHNAYPQQS